MKDGAFSSKDGVLNSIVQVFSSNDEAKSEKNGPLNSKDGVRSAIDGAFCENNGASSTDLPNKLNNLGEKK